jgi:DNA-binding SARP family transcriptional activator/tetratricopeptide (TPR) repeat protein
MLYGSDVRFRILGSLELAGDGGEAVELTGRNLRVLTAALLAQPNRTVSMSALIDAIWDEAPPASARKNLQSYVLRLRQLFGVQRIVTRPEGYRIVVAPEELDAVVFRDLLNAAAATGDRTEARALLVEAESLWRGPAYADLADVAALREQVARLTELRLNAVEERMDLDLALGAHAAITPELASWVAQYPLRERLRGLLMTALYRSGRQADALGTYQEGRERIAEELGIDPAPDLQAMHLAILRGDDPGPPPARVATPAATQFLPRDIPDFTGRHSEMAWLDAAAQQQAPIVVISGTGGLGKTALAVRWASRSAHRFPDGQLYLNLRGYSHGAPVGVTEALSQELRMVGVAATAVPDTVDEAAALLRAITADKRMLVVLDNVHSADQVRPMVPGGTSSAVIVTSRNRLGGLVARDGAQRLDLSILSEAESLDLLARIAGSDRVAAEPDAAADLVAICGHFPLALRIAAAQLSEDPERSIADLVAVLTHGQRTLALQIDDDRESAIRAVFDLSLAGLGADAAVLFRRLGLLPVSEAGTWVAAILGGLDDLAADTALAQLADASLIVLADDRFTMHDLVQVYAHEQSDESDVAALRSLYDTLLAMAVRADSQLESVYFPSIARFGDLVPDPDRWTAKASTWLEAERDILIRSAQDAVERGWTDTGWRLIASMTNVAGNMSFLGHWVEAAETILRRLPDGIGRAVLQLGLGGVYRLRGSQKEAAVMLRRARRSFARAGEEVFAATAATQLSAAARVRGDTRTARAAVDWAIDRLAGRPVVPQLGWAYLVRGNLLRHTGAEPYAVWVALDAALAILREARDIPGEANARFSLGLVLRESGRPDEALEHFGVARELMLAVEEDNTPALSAVDGAMARLHLDRGDLVAAAAHSGDGLAAARKLAQPYSLTQALTLSGEIARRRGDTDLALRYLDEAEGLARRTAALTLLGPVLFEQAKVHVERGDLALARSVAEEARDVYAQSGRDETELVEKWIADLPATE